MSAVAVTEPAERVVEEIDGATFRSIMASFPSGVAIVTTGDADGRPRGLTVTSACSVSVDPPLLLVCVNATSRTLPALRRSGRFVLNVMRAGRGQLGARFASKKEDKFVGVAWCATPTGLPVLAADALSWAECTTVSEIEAGDHVILLAHVERGGAAADGRPLVYFGRRFGSWIDEA
jgi:flavin reductase (DIM6/NTAB) family NADH-FMN oxidoreductase RutF